MLDILPGIENWIADKKKLALATVISTWGSGPRKIGEAMAISKDGETLGSVSGGCVESQVIEEARKVLDSGAPKQLQYGISHEEAWEVGLSCGGKLGLLVEPFFGQDEEGSGSMIWETLDHRYKNNLGGVLLTRLEDGKYRHSFILPDGKITGAQINETMIEKTVMAYKERSSQLLEEEGTHYFAKVIPRQSELIIIGAAHMAAELVQLGNLFGFKTIVIEPRGFFSDKADFPDPPDALHKNWPQDILAEYTFDQFTYAVTLSHDPKIDDQALKILLKSDVAYIGSLGSRRTHAARVERLTRAGYSEDQLARIHAPVGVNINAKSAGEIALSIMAEIIAVKNEHL